MGLFKKETTTNKIGRVRKCPQSGASVPSSKVVCPECGWEFDDGNDKESAVQRLSAELKKCHSFLGALADKTEGDVILSFAIPKTKNDLLELLIYFKSRRDEKEEVSASYGEKKSRRVFKTKYEECILKAKQFYKSDPDFIPLIKEYDNSKTIRIILTVVFSILFVAAIACIAIFHLKIC